MAEFHLPEFNVNSSSATEDIVKLMKIVKPQWEESDIEITLLTGGYSCLMYKVSTKNNSNDAVILKIPNLFAVKCLPYINYDFERKVIQFVSQVGIFPKIHAVLKKGYCYQYVKGVSIFDVTKQPAELKKVIDYEYFPFLASASKLAEIHSVKLENEDYSKSATLCTVLDVLENYYPSTPNPIFIDKQVLHKEFTTLMEYSKNFNFNIVLCHGDPHPGNMVWNKETNEVSFMDWELTSIGLQAFDIAYFLASLTEAAVLNLSGFLTADEDVAEEIKKKFIMMYLTEYSALNNFDLTDEYVMEFERQVKFCVLVWYIAMTIYVGPVMAEMSNNPKFDTLSEYGNTHFQRYLLVKDKVLAELQLINSLPSSSDKNSFKN